MTTDSAPDSGRQPEVLGADECWRLVQTTPVGRLGFTDNDGNAPHGSTVILPVNFIVFNRVVFIRTHRQTSIAQLAEGRGGIAFEVDHHDDTYQRGWSVLIQGSSRAAGADEMDEALAHTKRLGPWAGGDRSLGVAIDAREISGRRVSLSRSTR